MNEKSIKKYAEIMEELNLSALEITKFGQKVRLERNPAEAEVKPTPSYSPKAQAAEEPVRETVPEEGVYTLASPMIGAFYSAPAENQEPFVNVGDRVEVGDILCIIESMKLMNEIRSEVAGTVVEVCAANHQAIDYGHPLFRIKTEAS